MRPLTFLLPALALALPACIIVVDGDGDDDRKRDTLMMSFAGGPDGPLDVAEEVTLDSFTEIEAAAGTRVTVVPGDVSVIRLDARAAERTDFDVEDGTLSITCRKPCRNSGSRGRVEVVAAGGISAASVSSGASMTFAEGWGSASSLALAVSSGGSLDAQGLRADNVTATASSGGSLLLHASNALTASASSGGSIKYHGSPDRLTQQSSSGGSIRQAR